MIQQLLFMLRFQGLLAFTLQADRHSSSPHLKGIPLYCNCSHGSQACNKQTQQLFFFFLNPNHIRGKLESSSDLRQLEISSFPFVFKSYMKLSIAFSFYLGFTGLACRV